MAGTTRGFTTPGVIHGIALTGVGKGSIPRGTILAGMLLLGDGVMPTILITITTDIMETMTITRSAILRGVLHMPEEGVQLRTTAVTVFPQVAVIRHPGDHRR
jgi:hypothetical protein